MSSVTLLRLPYPVSSNKYWATRAWFDRIAREARASTYVTKEAEKYKEAVGWIAKAAGFRQPTTKPIEIGRMLLIPPATVLRRDHLHGGAPKRVKNGTRLDIDNCIKVTIDALKGIIYVDDKQIERIRGPIEYGEPKDPGGLEIEISVLPGLQHDLIDDGVKVDALSLHEEKPF